MIKAMCHSLSRFFLMCIRMRNATYTDFSDKERSKLRYSPSSLSTHGAASFISQNYNQRQRSKQKKMTATTAQVCSRFIFSSIPQLPPPPYHRHSPFFHFFLFFPVALLHSLLHTYTPRLPCCAPSSKQISLPVLLFTFTSTFFPFFFPLTFFLPCFPAIHFLSLTLYITLLLSPSFCCFILTVCFSFVVVAVLFLASFTVCFVHFLPTLLCAHTHSPSHFFFSALLLPCLAHRQRTSPHLHPSSPPRPCFLRRWSLP